MGGEEWIERLRLLGVTVVIPTYNNAGTIASVIRQVLEYAAQVIVVNDGSTDNTLTVLQSFPSVRLITYLENKGKGYALQKGLQQAAREGFRYALTIDSDGQHFPDDIPVFIREIEIHPDALLIGARNLTSDHMPAKNTFANRFSNFWFRLETGIRLTDSQSGYRLYPLEKLKNMRFFSGKYEFELEIMVRAAWRRIPVRNVPVKVYYPPAGERISHFRPFRDFSRISLLNSLFVLIAFFWYWPSVFFRHLNREHIRRFIREHITDSGESNLKLTFAVMLGLFMGIVPVWGYQMMIAVVLAHFLRLNKIIVLVCSNISIPPMIPFLLYGSYAVGGWVLDLPLTLQLHDVTFAVLKESLLQYLAGSMILATGISIAGGLLAFLMLTLFRKNKRKDESSVNCPI